MKRNFLKCIVCICICLLTVFSSFAKKKYEYINVTCQSADAIYELKGCAKLPVKNVVEENLTYSIEKPNKEAQEPLTIIDRGDLKGKRIAVIGDSYVKNHQEPVERTWHYKFAKKYSMEYLNYGLNGNSIAYTSSRWGKALYLRYKEMPEKLDYILVIGGHNDSYKLDSIGGIDAFKEKMTLLCEGLIDRYPTAKIFFFTRWNSKDFVGSNSQKVIDVMIEVCGNYSIPIFDSARKGGIYAANETFRKIYFQGSKDNTDTAHLNDKGHNRFFKVAENFILNY